MLRYDELLRFYRSGKGNGNWFRLRILDRVFFRAAIWYTRAKSMIANNRIVNQLKTIIGKLRTADPNRIQKNGAERAREMLTRFEANRVFDWAPQAKNWLEQSGYISWLGLGSQMSNDSSVTQIVL